MAPSVWAQKCETQNGPNNTVVCMKWLFLREMVCHTQWNCEAWSPAKQVMEAICVDNEMPKWRYKHIYGCWGWGIGGWALSYYSDLTLSQEFQPLVAQLEFVRQRQITCILIKYILLYDMDRK